MEGVAENNARSVLNGMMYKRNAYIQMLEEKYLRTLKGLAALGARLMSRDVLLWEISTRRL